MAKYLFVLNDAPYGSERIYNGLRYALTLSKAGTHELKLFLFGDAVYVAKAGQKVPSGHFNLEVVVHNLLRSGAAIGA